MIVVIHAIDSWSTITELTSNGLPVRLRNMKQGRPFVYLDVDEYDRIKKDNCYPEIWCTSIEGYWVQAVPPIVYELEFKGLMTLEERMSTYVIWYLTGDDSSAKI